MSRAELHLMLKHAAALAYMNSELPMAQPVGDVPKPPTPKPKIAFKHTPLKERKKKLAKLRAREGAQVARNVQVG